MTKEAVIVPTRTWFPDTHQIYVGDTGGPYLHSLWVGLTAPTLNLPMMLWYMILMPVSKALVYIVQQIVLCAIAGICGRIEGINVPAPTVTLTITQGKK